MLYKHSGRFSFFGLIVPAAVGFGAAVVLAFLYGWGIIHIPEVKLAVAATIAFGCLVGAAAGYGLVWGKVRNGALAAGFGGGVSILALYLSWAVWVAKTLGSQQVANVNWLDLAAQPSALWSVICKINQYGTWSLSSGTTTNGGILWIIWILEAVIVIVAGVMVGQAVVDSHPFCEACEAWCRRGAKILLAAPPSVPQLTLELQANNFNTLEKLGPANVGTNHLIVEMDSCERCRQFHIMNLTYATLQRTKKGKVSVHHQTILRQLLLGAGHAEVIRRISDKVTQTSAAVPKANAAGVGKR